MKIIDPKVFKKPKFDKLFSNLGPYYRSLQSSVDHFIFDCLEVCVDPECDFEKREFLGWCLDLSLKENRFSYDFIYGRYTTKSDWIEDKGVSEVQDELELSLNKFLTQLKVSISTDEQFILEEKP